VTATADPVRALQVLTCDGEGGTEHMVAAMVERLDANVVATSVVTLAPPGPIAHRLGAAGIGVRSLGGRGFWPGLSRLAAILRRERYDIVNAYGFKASVAVRVLVRLLAPRARFVSGVRGLHTAEFERPDGPEACLVLGVERVLSPLVHAYDANSRGALDVLAGAGVPRSRLHYIPNGIELGPWTVERPAAPNEVPTIVCVARFVPRKRHPDLLRATGELVRRGTSLHLVLVGNGPELARCRALVLDQGIDEHVTFAGAAGHDAVPRHLAGADVFCLPSAWEGMAGSVMEAMATGLPVVGTRVNGISDLVEDGRTGLLVPTRDPGRLAAALERLIDDAELRRRLGAAGRARIESCFSLEGMVKAKQDLFVGLAEKS
jgi:glycosyltransferase involved in cell wall biosynthesis